MLVESVATLRVVEGDGGHFRHDPLQPSGVARLVLGIDVFVSFGVVCIVSGHFVVCVTAGSASGLGFGSRSVLDGATGRDRRNLGNGGSGWTPSHDVVP